MTRDRRVSHRRALEIGGGTLTLDAPVANRNNPVREAPDLEEIMGNQQGGDPPLPDRPANILEDPALELVVETGQWLIQQKEVGTAQKRPSEGDPLSLSPRKVSRVARQQAAQLQDLHDPLEGDPNARLPTSFLSEPEIALDRVMREQQLILKDHSYTPSSRRDEDSFHGVDENPAVEFYVAFSGMLQAGQHLEDGRLSAPGGAIDGGNRVCRPKTQIELESARISVNGPEAKLTHVSVAFVPGFR